MLRKVKSKESEMKWSQGKWSEVKPSEAKWGKELCDLPGSFFQVSNWSIFSSIIFASYPSTKNPQNFIAQ